MLAWRQPFMSAGMAGHGWGFELWIYDNFSRSPTSQTIGDTLLLLSTPEADTEYPFVEKLAVEDGAQPAEIPNDVAVARPVENAKECATSLVVAVNKKGSQVQKSLSTDNRDKAPSSSAIARPKTSGRKKKASKKDKHSTDSAIVPTKGKGDEGSNDGDNPISSSQVVLYDPRVEECAVDTALEETGKGRTKRSLPSKDSEKEALPAKRRRRSKNLLPSQDSEAASDKDYLMCQMSIQTIIDAADQLKRIPKLIKSVRDAGFDHFIDTKIKGSINPPRPNENNEVLPELKQELGFRSDEDITAKKLVVMLTSMVNEHLNSKAVISTNLALKLFYLILFNKGLCVGIAPRISAKEASMVKGLDYGKIRDMDFCQLVVDELQSSATNWQGHEVLKYKYMEGLAVAPLIMYLDSLIYKDLAHMGKDTPRVLFLDEKKLTAISKADRNIGAQKGKEDWVFGKIITWKEKNDRVYKTISEEREEEIMATGEQQARIVEEGCKNKSKVMPKKKKKKHKDSNKTDSIGDQQLEEVHPDPEHHTGSLPDILNPGNPHIQESNKELAIQMSGKKATDEQQASIREQQLKETPLLQSIPLDFFHIPKNPLRNQPFKRLDAETSNVITEADAPDLETSAATMSETSADMLAESLDPNDDILYIRKRLLYLVLMWEKLDVNIDLIETFHKDDLIKINPGEYNLIRKRTTVKPTMTVIVSLPDINIPEPKDIDDGK
ncbi:hypothetical protein ACQ4PT_012613 [Festuca glaucescens]